MLQDQEGLYPSSTPLIFTDGTKFYEDLSKKYISHKKGYFILAPSGVGKSHYYRNQKEGEKHWIDADRLWRWSRAMPLGPWWEESGEICDQVDQQCDITTMHAKKLGFWMLGASNFWLEPDAIVIPEWETHVGYIKMREKNYDGGAKSDPESLERVKRHRKWIQQWAEKGVPEFKSVEDAINYIQKEYSKLDD